MKLRIIARLSALSALALSFTIMPMESPKALKKAAQKAARWTVVVGGMLTGQIPIGNAITRLNIPNDPFPFGNLPQDIQRLVILYIGLYGQAQSLEQAATTIKSLSGTTRYLNQLITNSDFFLEIVKQLSQRFNRSNWKVCMAFHPMPQATARLTLQQNLLNLCMNRERLKANDLEMIFKKLLKAGVDVDFTAEQLTPLFIAITSSNMSLVISLLDAGADPEFINGNGFTPLNMAVGKPQIIDALKEAIAKKYKKE